VWTSRQSAESEFDLAASNQVNSGGPGAHAHLSFWESLSAGDCTTRQPAPERAVSRPWPKRDARTTMRNSETQDCGAGVAAPSGLPESSPGLPRQWLPWVEVDARLINPNGVACRRMAATPLGLKFFFGRSCPRVGATHRPWARLHSPFGADAEPNLRRATLEVHGRKWPATPKLELNEPTKKSFLG
jgi:hypothetical protein